MLSSYLLSEVCQVVPPPLDSTRVRLFQDAKHFPEARLAGDQREALVRLQGLGARQPMRHRPFKRRECLLLVAQ